jgi:tRNA threonylcarbamoyladenosine biosynthesis protein TsaB
LKSLSIDTSNMRGSVALLEGGALLAELRLASLETHAARLLRTIEFLLGTAGWSLKDLGLIAAGLGPGSFTGIRIGLATALGLAQTLRVPFAGISGLDALAHHHSYLAGRIGIIMDAQREQVYYAEYASHAGRVKRIGTAGMWYPHDLKVRLARRRIHLIGDGAARYADELGRAVQAWRIIDHNPFLAGPIGRLALARKRFWRAGDYLTCEPLYIRPPDARRPGSRKNR